MARKGENIYKRKDGRYEGRYIKDYDMQGDIVVESDGKTVTITTAKNENVQTNPTEAEKLYPLKILKIARLLNI